MRHKFFLGLLSVLCWCGIQINGAQAQQPVVYALLFFSPSCGHCHYVITEFLPSLQEEYGEQLQVLFVDVSQPQGSVLFDAALDVLNVPADQSGYVPTLVIGTTVLVGSGDIPEKMPALVRDGLAAGGIDLPPVPGLRESYESAVGDEQTDNTQDNPPAAAPISTTYRKTTWQDRLRQDRIGNSLAIGVLGILLVGLAVQLRNGMRLFTAPERQHWEIDRLGWLFILGLAVLTMVIAATLMRQTGKERLPFLLAAGVTCGMALVVQGVMRMDRPSGQTAYGIPEWLLPLAACLGLVVAGYLAYVETGENEAVCGAVGDCNTVQQSEYARLFGLLPIGVLGMVGYLVILTVWLISRYAPGWVGDTTQALLLAFAFFGTTFSIYLTFLEPFVIGATCAWCLTSAMLMLLLLFLQAPTGWPAVNRLAEKLAQWPRRTNQPDW